MLDTGARTVPRLLSCVQETVKGRSPPGGQECRMCGACCRGLWVPLTRQEFLRISRALTSREGGLAVMAHTPAGACAALDPSVNRCSIYPERPGACRAFRPGEPRCGYAASKE